MNREDEFRMKVLDSLRSTGGWCDIQPYVSARWQLRLLFDMKGSFWITTSRRRMRITMEGRRALKCFERMYR